MSKHNDINGKFGKNHDKKNCPYCKSHKKHPNEFLKKSNGKEKQIQKKPVIQKEGVGLVPKMVKIARGILFDVCAHKNDGERFGYYMTDLSRGKWNHIVVNSKHDEKDTEKSADVIWSYEEGKFVKDKNGVMEIACLFNDSADVIQSRYEEPKVASGAQVVADKEFKPKEEVRTDEVKDGKVVKSYTLDLINGTCKNNVTGEEKKMDEMTDEEKKDVGFMWFPKKGDGEPKETKKEVSTDIIENAVEVAHRLKEERDAALSQLKKMTIAYKTTKARMDAIEKAAEYKDMVAKVDRIVFNKDENKEQKKPRSWKSIIGYSIWNTARLVAIFTFTVAAAVGLQRIWEAIKF